MKCLMKNLWNNTKRKSQKTVGKSTPLFQLISANLYPSRSIAIIQKNKRMSMVNTTLLAWQQRTAIPIT